VQWTRVERPLNLVDGDSSDQRYEWLGWEGLGTPQGVLHAPSELVVTQANHPRTTATDQLCMVLFGCSDSDERQHAFTDESGYWSQWFPLGGGEQLTSAPGGL
jgi:hypothetical protein